MQINFVEDKVTLLLSLFFRRCSHLYPKAGPMSGRPPDDWPTGGCIYADSIKSSMKRLRTCRTAKDNRKCQSSNRWWEENNTKSNIWPVHEQLDPMWNYFHSSLSSLLVLTFAFSLCWWLSFLDTVVFLAMSVLPASSCFVPSLFFSLVLQESDYLNLVKDEKKIYHGLLATGIMTQNIVLRIGYALKTT